MPPKSASTPPPRNDGFSLSFLQVCPYVIVRSISLSPSDAGAGQAQPGPRCSALGSLVGPAGLIVLSLLLLILARFPARQVQRSGRTVRESDSLSQLEPKLENREGLDSILLASSLAPTG
ncbi:hypothetical protein GGTG_10088 [Gaeumannomyces tritici R3-111a-1]|uniref:Uncharacterized protein n=1 Tax=Gaeumannomyces tritici (strain R3-111a-1) TaxID=644352 RepID=J3P9A5_GAET3|nr:hypothetical protein GGTG_10088 [Gaeumannomyces tritici R3-111a-1]EJT73241.1 hypothetical protein GGTG_10088 [Gaeumannomyces tritici R3-111a-1]